MMKCLLYGLPAAVACSTAEPLHHTVPQTLEISFVDRSWALSLDQMQELRRFRNAMPDGATVSLEACTSENAYFPLQRLGGIERFLTQGNPLEVDVTLCYSPSPQNSVYVSVTGYGQDAVADGFEEAKKYTDVSLD